jgi:hypothetical protein
MDPIRLAIALVPLAAYLVVLAAVHLRPRPTIWTGTTDNGYLAAGLVGLLLVGPMDSVMPYSSPLPGYYLWMLILLLYALSVTMWNLVARPRLVIFHTTGDQIRAALAQIMARSEPEGTAAGDSFVFPQAGMQFHLDSYPPLGNVTLAALGEKQSYTGWRRLRSELEQALNAADAPRTYHGYILGALSLALLVCALAPLPTIDRKTARRTMHEMLRLPPSADTG